MHERATIIVGHVVLLLLYFLFSISFLTSNPTLLLITGGITFLLVGFWTGITSVDHDRYAFFPAFAVWTFIKIAESVYATDKFLRPFIKLKIEPKYSIWKIFGELLFLHYAILILLFFLAYFATRGIRRNNFISRKQMEDYKERITTQNQNITI